MFFFFFARICSKPPAQRLIMDKRRLSIVTETGDAEPSYGAVGSVLPYVTPRLRTRRPSLGTSSSTSLGTIDESAAKATPESARSGVDAAVAFDISGNSSSASARSGAAPKVAFNMHPHEAESSVGSQAVGSAFMRMRMHPDSLVVNIASLKIINQLADMGGGYKVAAANQEVQDCVKSALLRLGAGQTSSGIQLRNLCAKYLHAIEGAMQPANVKAPTFSALKQPLRRVAGPGGRMVPMTPRQAVMMTSGNELQDRVELLLRERGHCTVESVRDEWDESRKADVAVKECQDALAKSQLKRVKLREAQYYEKAAEEKKNFEMLQVDLTEKLAVQSRGVHHRDKLCRAGNLVAEAEMQIVEQSELMKRVAALDDDARAAEICRSRDVLIDSIEKLKSSQDFQVLHTPPRPFDVVAKLGDYRQIKLTWKDGGNSCNGFGACAVRYRVYLPPQLSRAARKSSVSASTPKGGRRPVGFGKFKKDWHSMIHIARRVKWVNSSKNGLKCAFETNTMSNGKGQGGTLVKKAGKAGSGGLPRIPGTPRTPHRRVPGTPSGRRQSTTSRGGRQRRGSLVAAPVQFGVGGQLNVPPPQSELMKTCSVEFNDLDAKETHRFCVAAVSARGVESIFSVPIELKPRGLEYVTPPAPTHVIAMRQGLNQLLVTWSAKHCKRGDPNAGFLIECDPPDIAPIEVWGHEQRRRKHVKGGGSRRVTKYIEHVKKVLVTGLEERVYTFTVRSFTGDMTKKMKKFISEASAKSTGDKSPHGAISVRTPPPPVNVVAISRGDGETVRIEWEKNGDAPDTTPVVLYTVRICEASREKHGADIWTTETGEAWEMKIEAPRTSLVLTKLKCGTKVGGFEVIATCAGDGEGGTFRSRYDGPISLGLSSKPSHSTLPVLISDYIQFKNHRGPWEHICDFKWRRCTPWIEEAQTAHEDQAMIALLATTISRSSDEVVGSDGAVVTTGVAAAPSASTGTAAVADTAMVHGETGGAPSPQKTKGKAKLPWTIAEMEGLKRAFAEETLHSDLESFAATVKKDKARQHITLVQLCVKELKWEEVDADKLVAKVGESGDTSLLPGFVTSSEEYAKICKKFMTITRKLQVERKARAGIKKSTTTALHQWKPTNEEWKAMSKEEQRKHSKKAFLRNRGGVVAVDDADGAAAASTEESAAAAEEGTDEGNEALFEKARWERVAGHIPNRDVAECQLQLRVQNALTESGWQFDKARAMLDMGETMGVTGTADLAIDTRTSKLKSKKATKKALKLAASQRRRGSVPTHKNGAPVWEAKLPDKGKSIPPFIEPVDGVAYSALYLYRDKQGHWLIDGTAEGVREEWGHVGIYGSLKPKKLIGGAIDRATSMLTTRLEMFFDEVGMSISNRQLLEMLQKYSGRERELVLKLERAHPGSKVPLPQKIGGMPPELISKAGMLGPYHVPTDASMIWRYRKVVPSAGAPGRPMRTDPDLICSPCEPEAEELSAITAYLLRKFGSGPAAYNAISKGGEDATSIEKNELITILDAMNLSANIHAEFDAIIDMCDENFDGHIDFQEFWQHLGFDDDAADAAESRSIADCFEKVRDAIALETDGSDTISLDAVESILTAMNLGDFHHIFETIVLECDDVIVEGKFIGVQEFWLIYSMHEKRNA